MEKRSRFQNMVLLFLAGMILVFGLLTAVQQNRKGVLFEGGMLRQAVDRPEYRAYAGKVNGTPVSVTVTREPADGTLTEVVFIISGVAEDVCQVEYPLAPIQTESGELVDGVRVTKNGVLLFEGGYADSLNWYGPDGTRNPAGFETFLRISTNFDPWLGYETDAAHIMAFALGPELTTQGSWGLYAVLVFCTLLIMLDVAFPLALFHLRYCWYVEDPAPTEFYFAMQRFSWVLFSAVLLGVHIWALFQIF